MVMDCSLISTKTAQVPAAYLFVNITSVCKPVVTNPDGRKKLNIKIFIATEVEKLFNEGLIESSTNHGVPRFFNKGKKSQAQNDSKLVCNY